jgi:hypothetical protein
MGLTGSHFVGAGDVAPETRRYYQQLSRFSAAFAFLADVSMFVMGGDLKRKEKLSARLGDILSLMYLASATLKRYEAEGRQAADAPLMHWAIWDAMFRMQNAFEGVISNYPNRFIAALLHWYIFPLGRPYEVPSDKLGHEVAQLLIEPSATRDRLTAGMFVPRDEAGCRSASSSSRWKPRWPPSRSSAHPQGVKEGKVGARRHGDHGGPCPRSRHHHRRGARAAASAGRAARSRHAVDDFPQDFAHEASTRSRRRPVGCARLHEDFHEIRTCLHRRWRALALPQVAQRPRPLLGFRSRHDFRARAAGAPALCAGDLDEVIVGCASPSVDEVNIGRVIALRLGCGNKVPGWTVMRNCASGMQALDSAIANIHSGRSQLVLAGGVDALSRAPLLYSDKMVLWFSHMAQARTWAPGSACSPNCARAPCWRR